jgi:4'-phosphopantetheinyl transferase
MNSPPSLVEGLEDPSQVDLWLARESQWRDPALLDHFSGVLSADERARIAGMKFEAGRHQQFVSRALVRSVLSTYLPAVPPADWRFERGEHGRPSVARDMIGAARSLQFNLAHTDGLVVMAVGRTPRIGVDVERIDGRVRLAVARRYFSTAEADALEALPADQRDRRFRRLWTLKEACLKAVGTGISGGLGGMTFHFEDDGVRFERASDPDASRWAFREFEVDGEYLVALACLAPDAPAVRLRDYLPVR